MENIEIPSLSKNGPHPFTKDELKELVIQCGATGIGKGVYELFVASANRFCKECEFPKLVTQWDEVHFSFSKEWLSGHFPSAADRKLVRPRLFHTFITLAYMASRMATVSGKRKFLNAHDVSLAHDFLDICASYPPKT